MQRKDEADDCADDEDQTGHIECAKHATPVRASFGWFVGEEEEDEEARNAAYGKVDVEAAKLLARPSKGFCDKA